MMDQGVEEGLSIGVMFYCRFVHLSPTSTKKITQIFRVVRVSNSSPELRQSQPYRISRVTTELLRNVHVFCILLTDRAYDAGKSVCCGGN